MKTEQMKTIGYSALFILMLTNAVAQNKILFDASKGESAGNADWVIDADNHNLGVGSNGAYLGGNESNPQRYPNPLQSGVTPATTETYWNGALSYWAIDCVKKGYLVETLPWTGAITYGNSANPQDLSNYKAYIVDEPNLIFTAAEKTAIINFVANGGGLFMISDHDNSDRNGDGFDSPHIWNDLMTSNSVAVNPFGISFDYVDISGTYSNIAALPSDPILHGSTGDVNKVQWSDGTTMTLNTTQNSTIKGVVFKTGNSGNTNVLCAYGTYGAGKIAAVGDSSITDDGTGDAGDSLYDGYISDANGNHQRLLMNITNWLMDSNLGAHPFGTNSLSFKIAPNPAANHEVNLSYTLSNNEIVELSLYNTLGQNVKKIRVDGTSGFNYSPINTDGLKGGLYIVKIVAADTSESKPVIIL